MHSALLVSDAYHLYRARNMMAREGVQVYISPRPGSVPKTAFGRWMAALREELQLHAVPGACDMTAFSALGEASRSGMANEFSFSN